MGGKGNSVAEVKKSKAHFLLGHIAMEMKQLTLLPVVAFARSGAGHLFMALALETNPFAPIAGDVNIYRIGDIAQTPTNIDKTGCLSEYTTNGTVGSMMKKALFAKRIRRLLVGLTLLLVAVPTVWALNPNLPPGSNFNLNNWYIQFPTENGSLTCSAGSVDSATTAQLIDGYTNAPYFYTGTDGAMVFWAPINGALTSGSPGGPRSELREEISPGDTSVNWIPYGTHILNAQCKVLQVPPSSEEVIIGQIHAESGGGLPTLKIYYDNGKVYGQVKTNSTDDGSEYDFPSVSVGLSNSITYEIELVNGLVTVAINSKTNSYNIFQSDPNYTNVTQYFKAGDYCQA